MKITENEKFILNERKTNGGQSMKVYALWHEENGYEYRWRTILQFGNDWNVIGSVYMKNPGSAYPIANPDTDTLKLLKKKFSDSNEWKVFDSDNTMDYIEKLFEEAFLAPLNGVIQIFNLFNLRNADLASALKVLKGGKCNNNYAHTFDEDLKNLVFPVYIGWGNLWNDPYFEENNYSNEINSVFDRAKELAGAKWHFPSKMEDNHFFHPKYLYLHPTDADKEVEAEKKSFLSMF